MINIHTRELEGNWFGLACVGTRIVATAVDRTREGIIRSLKSRIPPNVKHQVVEKNSSFAEETMRMLKELHAGNEETKAFALAEGHFPAPSAGVLKAAAAIPIGYVTSYGDIARAAGTGPRVVGQIMASNPIYPLVPCHRVVGSDFSLVGYGGRTSPSALRAKLNRLSKEARGFPTKRELAVDGKRLTVYPVECVLRKARGRHSPNSNQQPLFEE